ncbi:LexA family protein [Streptomyces sp. NPDC091027]|uniref:LexA family protein n=1 Tax=Streptomyces sp. NPDC091027 TaxID=3365971 RepID=UPI003814FBC7
MVGDSMIEAAICDGDIVTVRKADSADHGDIVVSFLWGRSVAQHVPRGIGAAQRPCGRGWWAQQVSCYR